jgi:hypothetical protein
MFALPQHRPSTMWATYLGIAVFILLAGGIGGMAVATGTKMLIVPVFGLVFGLFLLLLPVEWILIALVAFAFLIAGLVGYFAKISQIFWVPYILGLAIWLITLAEVTLRGRIQRGAWPFVLWAFVIYLLMLGINVLINPQSPGVYLIAAKNYLFLLSVFLAGFLLIRKPETYEVIWKFLLLVALLQLPVVIYQYVVIGGKIADTGGQGWDAVSGSFGGSESGGSSGFMGIYLVTMLVLLVALFRNQAIRARKAAVFAVVCMTPVFMAEVKAIFLIFLPLAFFWLFRKAIVRNPFQAGFWSLVFVAMMAGGLIAYDKLHYQASSAAIDRTLLERVEQGVLLETDPDYLNVLSGEMGRTALLVFWWRQHGLDEPDKLIFGHGLGSLRVSSFYVGEVQKRFPRQRLDRNALSILLWDTGVAGACAYILLLLAGSRLSLRLSASTDIPARHRAYLETGGIYLILALVSLLYNRSVIDHPGMILLVMLSLGQAAFWFYRLRTPGQTTS